MAEGGSEAPMVDEFELFRAQAMGCGAAVEATYTSSPDNRCYTPPDSPERGHDGGRRGRDSSPLSDSLPRRHQSSKRSKRDYISDREIGFVTGDQHARLLEHSAEDTAERYHERRGSRPKSTLISISPNTLSQDDNSYRISPSPNYGMQRSHSCRIRRAPRLASPQRESPVRVTVSRTNGDDQGTSECKLSRNRNKTMPARRHNQQKAQKLTVTPASLNPNRRSYQDIPDTGEDECSIYRVRSFTTTNSGIVNRGDSFKIRRTGSGRSSFKSQQPSSRKSSQASIQGAHVDENVALLSAVAGTDRSASPHHHTNGIGSIPCHNLSNADNIPSISIETSSNQDNASHVDINAVTQEAGSVNDSVVDDDNSDGEHDAETSPIYRVLVLGSQEVGRTTLTHQLLTSEYLANKDTSLDDENGEKIVSVLLDDEESMVQFVDTPRQEVIDWEENVDAFVIVYSVTDRSSFSYAQACLQDLRMRTKTQRSNAVILVGNKQDSVRNRSVSEHDGRCLATKRNCKFIEVSALLDHRVDELLVGVIRQIRLKQRKGNEDEVDSGTFPTGCLQRAAFGMFRKLFRRTGNLSKSCDNLMT